jgi:hypothetical protein
MKKKNGSGKCREWNASIIVAAAEHNESRKDNSVILLRQSLLSFLSSDHPLSFPVMMERDERRRRRSKGYIDCERREEGARQARGERGGEGERKREDKKNN